MSKVQARSEQIAQSKKHVEKCIRIGQEANKEVSEQREVNKAGYTAQDAPSTCLREGIMDLRTDRRTNGWTDRRTDGHTLL